MKELEDQIGELEAEASRLLRALEHAKDAKAEAERSEKRRVDEAAREVASVKVEMESLRAKAQQYTDYDEIKRELEIMKVRLLTRTGVNVPVRRVCWSRP